MISGLPQSRVNDAVASLVRWEIMLVLLTLGAAGAIGAIVVLAASAQAALAPSDAGASAAPEPTPAA